jgi:hypothetical protein
MVPKRVSVVLIWILLHTSNLCAETINDHKLEFSLRLPPGFAERSELLALHPDNVHAFDYQIWDVDTITTVLIIQKMGGVLPRLDIQNELTRPTNTKRFSMKWQTFEVVGSEVPVVMGGVECIQYNVQIPLKREAILIQMFGPRSREEAIRALLREVLDGLEGQSNWIPSALSAPLVSSHDFRTIRAICLIGIVAIAIVAQYYFSRKLPKGTILALSLGLYLLSWPIGMVQLLELRFVTAILRISGLAGIIIGIIDVFRRRVPKHPTQTTSSTMTLP